MLEAGTPSPVVSQFSKDFLREPALREALQRYKREKGGDAPAVELMQALAVLPEFRRVVTGFRGEPGFQGAFLKLSKNPEIGAVLAGMTASLKRASARGGAGKVAAGRRSSALASSRSVSVSLPAAASFLTARGGESLASLAPNGATGSSRVAGWAAESDGAGAGPASAAPGASDSSEGNGDGMPELVAPSSAEQYRDASDYLASLFANAPKALRDALLYQCEVNNICDPLEACRAAGRYAECRKYCDTTPSCGGLLPPQTTETASTDKAGGDSETCAGADSGTEAAAASARASVFGAGSRGASKALSLVGSVGGNILDTLLDPIHGSIGKNFGKKSGSRKCDGAAGSGWSAKR